MAPRPGPPCVAASFTPIVKIEGSGPRSFSPQDVEAKSGNAPYLVTRASWGMTPFALVATSTLLPGFSGSSGHSGT